MSKKYSELKATLNGTMLSINYERARKSTSDSLLVDIADMDPGSTESTKIKSKSFHYSNKILLVDEIESTGDVLVVYTDGGRVLYYRHSNLDSHPLSRFIIVRSKVFFIRLSKQGLRLAYACGIINKYRLPIESTSFSIGNEVSINKSIPVFTGGVSIKSLLSRGLFTDYIKLSDLLKGEPSINERIGINIKLKDSQLPVEHFLSRGTKKYTYKTKWYYAPITQTRRDGYSVSIRRNGHGGLSIVRRQLEDIENDTAFRFYESKLISFFLYNLAHIVRKLSKRKVNLYFEKMASQAEEGALELFRKARDESKKSSNYFILRKDTDAYKDLNGEKNVTANFTLKSYWLMYRANNIIATEVPQHMNILRSGNKFARRAPYSQTFVFLQHGVTYLKPQDKTTSFKKGREGEPDYMIVNSKKERDITSDMLGIQEERLLVTGMPIFDTIKYSHINEYSPDTVTIMLTWKPYEEHLQDFEKSSYYKTTIVLYEMLKTHIPQENIRIIAHPKFKKHMLGTDIEHVLWQDSVSKALNDTKLLITDYSSVCYNVFYQGGGVIFYQPDLELYQQSTGNLIPTDDEYIGYRVFDKESIQSLISKTINKGKIDLLSYRTDKFTNNYKSINEYHDSKNIDRIYSNLVDLNIL